MLWTAEVEHAVLRMRALGVAEVDLNGVRILLEPLSSVEHAARRMRALGVAEVDLNGVRILLEPLSSVEVEAEPSDSTAHAAEAIEARGLDGLTAEQQLDLFERRFA